MNGIASAPTDLLPDGWQVEEFSPQGLVRLEEKRLILTHNIHPDTQKLIEQHSSIRVEQLQQEIHRDLLHALLKDEDDPVSGFVFRTKGHNLLYEVFRDHPELIVQARERGLEALVRAGIGVNDHFARLALQQAISLFNTPEANRESVHRAVVSLLKHLFHPLLNRSQHLKMSQKWGISPKSWNIAHLDNPFKRDERDLEIGMKPVKLLVVGAGGIGARVAMDAVSMGMEVLYCDKKSHIMIPRCRRVDLKQGMKEADVVSVNVNGEEEVITPELLDDFEGVFINTSRGGTVNGPALRQAIEEGRISSGYLDVLPVEGQQAFDDETTRALILDGEMIVTDHILGYERDAQMRNGKDAAFKAIGALRSGATEGIYEGPQTQGILTEVFENGGPSYLLRINNVDVEEVHSQVFDALRRVLREECHLAPDEKPINKGASHNDRSELRVVTPGGETQRYDFLMSHLEFPEGVDESILQRALQVVSEIEHVLRARLYRFSKR